MKKVFLLAAVAFATSVNAQVIQVDGEALGLNKDEAVALTAGTAVGSNAAIDVTIAFDDTYKLVDNKAGLAGTDLKFNQIEFDGNVVVTKTGIQGLHNPKDAEGKGPAVVPAKPVSGAYTLVTAKEDGMVYVASKLSSNKSYAIFEDGASIGYKFAVQLDAADDRIKGALLSGALSDEDAKNPQPWLIRIVTGEAEGATAGNGLGVLAFPVYKGSQYLVGASGSKITWCGVYYKAQDDAVIALSEDTGAAEKVTIYDGTTGIANVAAAKAENGRMFNLAGQEVSKNFKGIVVVNGKKFMNK
ncbi:MAG: hypothetical protein IJ549_06710 [Prevotella sp.]|nr:hypothetical protein [Prevotella sp.]